MPNRGAGNENGGEAFPLLSPRNTPTNKRGRSKQTQNTGAETRRGSSISVKSQAPHDRRGSAVFLGLGRTYGVYSLYIAAVAAALLFIMLFEQSHPFATLAAVFGTFGDGGVVSSSELAASGLISDSSDAKVHGSTRKKDRPVVATEDRVYVFVGGLQRSGTTLLSEVLEQQTWTSKMHVRNASMLQRVADLQGLTVGEIAGIFHEGGVEGKFVQDVYPYQYLLEIVGKGQGVPSDLVLPGPESDEEAASKRTQLLAQWDPFWDLTAKALVEKTPENIFLAPFLEKVFGPDRTAFVFSLRHPLVWAIVTEKWIGPQLFELATVPKRIELWFQAMEIARQHAGAVKHGTLFNLESVHRDDFVGIFPGSDNGEQSGAIAGLPRFVDETDLEQESKDLIDGSLSYISCWLRGLEYSSCTRRCTSSRSQAWLSQTPTKAAAKRNRQILATLTAPGSDYEARANVFGYTFKGVQDFFAKSNIVFDKTLMIHPFASRSWGQKGCALLNEGSRGCDRSQAMDSFDVPVRFKNGVLVAAPKLLSISNEKAINGMVQREEQMLKALTGLEEQLDVHIIHYDAYVLEPSDNLDRFHCAKSVAHTYNARSTREQYEQAIHRIQQTNVNLVASILVFTTATMNMHKEAHAGDNPGGKRNPRWFEGPGTNEPMQMIGSWLRQDFGPAHRISVMTDDIHSLRSKKVLEDHEPSEIAAASESLRKMEVTVYGSVADAVITVSPEDGESIKAMGIDTDLRWLPFIAKATPPSQIPPATGRQGLLYCASLNPIAAAAVEFLVEEVLPLLPAELQHLVIVGPYWRENLPNLPKLQESPYLEFTGPVSDDELQKYYDTKRVFVAPLLESTGIATKIINAMSKGLPVVTTALGLNGIGLSLDSAHGVVEVHNDAAGFVSAIQSLVQDDFLWQQLSTAAAHHVRTQLNEDQQRKVLRRLLTPSLAKKPELGDHAKLRFAEDPGPSKLSADDGSYWINPGITALPSSSNFGNTPIDGAVDNDLMIAVRLHNGKPLSDDATGAFRWESEIWLGKLSGGSKSLFCDCPDPISIRRLEIFSGLQSCDYSAVAHQDESDGPEDPRMFVFNGKVYLFVVSRPMVKDPAPCGNTLIQQFLVGPLVADENAEGAQSLESGVAAVPLSLARPGVVEKNWSPFEYEGQLMASRFVFPAHRVVKVNPSNGECTDVPGTDTQSTPLMNLVQTYVDQHLPQNAKNFRVSGGTPAVLVRHVDESRNYYLAVLHITRLPKDGDQHSIGRNYDNYAYKFEPKPPFAIKAVSKRLVLVTDAKTHGQERIANTSIALVTGIALEKGSLEIAPKGQLKSKSENANTLVALSYGVGNSRSYVSRVRLADLEKQFARSRRWATTAGNAAAEMGRGSSAGKGLGLGLGKGRGNSQGQQRQHDRQNLRQQQQPPPQQQP